jgi:TRAP-type C4-dicarboxylate transport system permease small subunit
MKLIARLTDWLAALPLFALLAIFNAAVVMRYFVDRPLQWTEEIAGLLMVWIVMLGGISAERDNQHLAIPVLVDLLSPKVTAALNLLVSLLSAAFLLYVSYVGLMLALSVKFKVTDILRISYFWIDIAIPIGFVVIAAYMVVSGVDQARKAIAEAAR